jgi:hypothetical protein
MQTCTRWLVVVLAVICGGGVQPHNSCELSRTPIAFDPGHACICYRSSNLNDAPPMQTVEYLQHGIPRSVHANLVLQHIDSYKAHRDTRHNFYG